MTNLLTASLTADFWQTGFAMIRYLPRSFRVWQVDGMDFFTESRLAEYRSRIAALTPQSRGHWGTMTVDQGLHHLNLACGHAHGFYTLPDESYLTSRTVFRWILVDWFPEQPQGLRLPTGFKIPHDQHFDFFDEQAKLILILETAWKKRSAKDWGPHCTFGRMSLREWGKLLQIHIDYHLRQFGV
ncbi:DUF1569 domain-containing protein [Silvibacterium sp.]|uniref:DUF1569 domain-containing protein n=1 Tax=Silvibacterium sp. TaxID=1964179 RepID=UPI0039E5AF01